MALDRSEPNPNDDEITYRDDGKIPVGIWIVWVAFAVFAVIYASRYAWPDFLVWLQASKGK